MTPFPFLALFGAAAGMVLGVAAWWADRHAAHRLASLGCFAYALWAWGQFGAATAVPLPQDSLLFDLGAAVLFVLWNAFGLGATLVISELPPVQRRRRWLGFFLAALVIALVIALGVSLTAEAPDRGLMRSLSNAGLFMAGSGLGLHALACHRKVAGSNRARRQRTLGLWFHGITLGLSLPLYGVGAAGSLPWAELVSGLLLAACQVVLITKYRFRGVRDPQINRDLIAGLPEAVLLVDQNLRIQKGNPAARQLFGLDSPILENTSLVSLFDQGHRIAQAWEDILASKETMEVSGCRIGGGEVHVVVSPGLDALGDVIGAMVLIKGHDLFSFNSLRYGLSPSEKNVVRLLVQGLTDKEIAEKTFLSPQTIKTHIRNVLRKIGVNSRVDAMRTLLGS